MLRRTLLVLVTALVVARPLVRGEDPGLANPASDNGSMVLSLLWLLVGVGWAAWRLGARRGEWYVGIVEAALGLAVVLFFISAENAAYKHPARIIAWEWLILLVAFLVVRHLAITPDVRHGLFCTFLATGVMVAAHGVYQRLHDGYSFGTFAHADSFAGYLVLLLPGLVGMVVVCLRIGIGASTTRLVATAALLGLAALAVTHSRSAILALIVVALGSAAICWRRQLLATKWFAAVVVALSVIAVGMLYWSSFLTGGEGKDTGTLDSWSATTKIIAAHPWLGVGPGNFGGYYPRYLAETGGEKLQDPHNFVLELWATGGVFVLLAVLTALGAVFVFAARGLESVRNAPLSPVLGGEGSGVRGVSLGTLQPPHPNPSPPSTGERGFSDSAKPQTESEVVRWEYYLGGVLGLLLGFSLRMTALNDANAILQEGIIAAARSLVWFFAFALFERIHWTDRQRAVALTAGIAALLLHLGTSGGIGFPSIAGPLWFAVALLLASLPLSPRVFERAPLPSLGLPVPVLAALTLLYLIFCFYPVSSSLSSMREAEQVIKQFRSDRVVLSGFCASTVGLCAANPEGMGPMAAVMLSVKARDIRNWAGSIPMNLKEGLEKKSLKLLQEAKSTDPDNARVWVQLGLGYVEHWEFSKREEVARFAVVALNQAEERDPTGLEPLLAWVQLASTFARYHTLEADAARRARKAVAADPKLTANEWRRLQKEIEGKEKESRSNAAEYLFKAAEKLRKATQLDPTDASLRYRLAEMLDRAGDPSACRQQAREALRLYNLSTRRPRSLADPQLRQAEAWAETGANR